MARPRAGGGRHLAARPRRRPAGGAWRDVRGTDLLSCPGERRCDRSTSHVFFAGHRIRLQIASGGFPKHPRNLGTDEPFATGTTKVQAENRVFHDAERPSRLVLPVIPR